jgi:glyoxylate reductase
MAPRLVITRRLPAPVEARAKASFDAALSPDDRALVRDEMVKLCEGAAALLPCVADRLDADVINAMPDTVRIIANFGVGTDHIDLEAARARKIAVTNTPGVLTEATADLTLLLILAATRRAREGTNQLHEGTWPGWSPTHLLGHALQGKHLGIVGMGRIGRAVAARARAFGLEIHYHNRTRLDAGLEADARYHDTLKGLLGTSDVLSLHCAATAETRGLIHTGTLTALPKGAVLVNTARGDIVDDDAVIAALRSGHLSAAGLDVFRGEPDIDPRYRELPNAFLLPHLGSATVEARTAMGMLALDNLDAYFRGETPPHLVA